MTPPIRLLTLALLFAGIKDAGKVEIKPATIQAFERYIQKTEAAIVPAQLWVDGSPARKQQVLRGDVAVEPVAGSGDFEVPDGLVHDWAGAVFVRGATLPKVIAMFQDYDNARNIYKPEVVDSKLLAHHGSDFQFSMRLLKKQVVTVVLNTTHDVHYTAVDPTHWISRSTSTRIAEVENPGKSTEAELPPGHDHGFLWRLNSYWRFAERDGGVYVECQAVSLTRNVPTGLGWLINPIIRSLPRQSLENTLRSAQKAALKLN